MKTILTISFSLLITFTSFTQCEYLGGDMENFEDVTAEFDESGILPAGTIITPENQISLFRLLNLFFASFLLDPTSAEYQELWSLGFGFTMSDDAASGDHALQIGGDKIASLSDLYAINACNEIPSGFQFSYKHIGESPDTLLVIVLISNGTVDDFPETEEDLASVPAYVQWEIVVNSTQEEYTTVTLPVVDNELGIEVDTALSFILVSGDPDYFNSGGASYFLLDDISYTMESEFEDFDMDGFTSDVDCDDMDADINPDAIEIPNNDVDENCDGLIETTSIEEISAVNIIIAPNPIQEIFTISSEENVKFEIFDLNGRSQLQMNTYRKEHVISADQLGAGFYMIKLTDMEDRSQFKKIIIQ